jgi:hypothetical protein
MAFPYATRAQLTRELQYTQADFPGVADESDWNALLDRALRTASERVEGEAYAGRDWRGANADPPTVVEAAVIRLARHRIASIREDGLSSEDLVSGAGYEYRPPAAIRTEVQQELARAGYTTRYTGSAKL